MTTPAPAAKKTVNAKWWFFQLIPNWVLCCLILAHRECDEIEIEFGSQLICISFERAWLSSKISQLYEIKHLGLQCRCPIRVILNWPRIDSDHQMFEEKSLLDRVDWIVSIWSVDTFSVPASNNSQIFSSCVHLFSSSVQSATFSLICLVLWQHCLFALLHPILIVSHRHHHFYPLLLLLRAR